MTNPNLQNKYYTLPPSFNWPAINGTRFMTARMGDIDADGCDEVIAYMLSPQGQISGTISILSYFNYAALQDEWMGTDINEQLLTSSSVAIPNYQQGNVYNFHLASIRNKGITDVFLFDNNQTLQFLGWGKDSLTNNAFINYMTVTGVVTGINGQANWDIWTDNEFYIGDIDNDGIDEIILKNRNIGTSPSVLTKLAVAKASQTDMNIIWTTDAGLIPGSNGQSSWNTFSSDQFVMGDIDKDGQNEIVVFDGSSYVGVLKWNLITNILECIYLVSETIAGNNPANSWTVSSSDWFHMYTIDYTGLDSQQLLLIFNGIQVSAVNFDGSQLSVIATSSTGVVYGPNNNVAIIPENVYYFAPILNASFDAVLTFASNGGFFPGQEYISLGIFHWDQATQDFVADFAIENVPFGEAKLQNDDGTIVWYLGVDNTFCCADVDGDGIAEIIVQSDEAAAMAYLKWNGESLVPIWMYSATSGQPPLTGWGIPMVAAAPTTQFDPDDNDEIYINISQSLAQVDDIRSLYPNSNNAGNWSAYVSTSQGVLNDLQNNIKPGWSWIILPQQKDSVIAKLQLLIPEFKAVSFLSVFVYVNLNGYDGVLDRIAGGRKADLNTVELNFIGMDQPDGAAIYQADTIFQALLAAVIALPIGPVFQIPAAVVASLYGSFLNSDSGNVGLTQDALNSQIDQDTTTAEDANNYLLWQPGNPPTGIFTDPVKLAFFSKCIPGNTWFWNPSVIGNGDSDFNRTLFYMLLLNQYYTAYKIYSPSPSSVTSWLESNEIPLQAQWYMTDDQNATAIVLAENNNLPGSQNAVYASQALVDDLFTNLKFSVQNLFNGGGQLNLQINNDIQLEAGIGTRPPIYTTNNTDDRLIWITIYNIAGIGSKIMASGWLDTNSTFIWTENVGSGELKIRAEIKSGNSGGNNIADISQHIDPRYVTLEQTSASSYALSINGSNGNYEWQILK